MRKSCTDEDFINLFETLGASGLAKKFSIDIRNVYARRRRLEAKGLYLIKSPHRYNTRPETPEHPQRQQYEVKDGTVLVASDAHYWPEAPTTAHRAFVHFCKKLNPKVVVMNGDALDGATISRWPQIGWESRPSLINELEVTQERLDEIYKASKGSKHVWPLGNHDGRFEMRLAQVAPEFSKIHGVHLKDHIPEWTPCWACWINDEVVIKHRFKGGVHATHNNTMWSGKTIVTGHDHMLKVTPFADYNGLRWGVSTGTLADPYGKQFVNYTEDSPKNWTSGFIVLTFKNRKLLWPETVRVISENEVDFRGEIIHV